MELWDRISDACSIPSNKLGHSVYGVLLQQIAVEYIDCRLGYPELSMSSFYHWQGVSYDVLLLSQELHTNDMCEKLRREEILMSVCRAETSAIQLHREALGWSNSWHYCSLFIELPNVVQLKKRGKVPPN